MNLYKFVGKVKKSNHQSEEVYCIAKTQQQALDKISRFTENASYVSTTELKGWDRYVS